MLSEESDDLKDSVKKDAIINATSIQQELLELLGKLREKAHSFPLNYMLPDNVAFDGIEKLIGDKSKSLDGKFKAVANLFTPMKSGWIILIVYSSNICRSLLQQFKSIQTRYKHYGMPQNIIASLQNIEFRQTCDKKNIDDFIERLSAEQVYELIATYWTVDEFARLGYETFAFSDLTDACIPADQRQGELLNRYNQARINLSLPPEMPENYRFPGTRWDELQKKTPAMLYQLADDDIRAGEVLLERSKKSDSPIEYILIPFTDAPFDQKIPAIVSSYSVKEGDKPIILHGTVQIDNNHFVPFFIFKNSAGEIYIYTINPTAAKKPDQSNASLESFFKTIFPKAHYRDASIAQQLQERDCAINSLQSQLDAISNSLFTIENQQLVFHPECLTVNGNKSRSIYYQDNALVYIYDESLNQLSNTIREQWANHFNTVESDSLLSPRFQLTEFTLNDLQNPDESRFEPFHYPYSYQQNIHNQLFTDTNKLMISEIKMLHEQSSESRTLLADLTKKFIDLNFSFEQGFTSIKDALKRTYTELDESAFSFPGIEWFDGQSGDLIIGQAIQIHLKESLFNHLIRRFEFYCDSFKFDDYCDSEQFIQQFIQHEEISKRLELLNDRFDFINKVTKQCEPFLLKGYYRRHVQAIKSLIKNLMAISCQNTATEGDCLVHVLNQIEQHAPVIGFLKSHEDKLAGFRLTTLTQLVKQQFLSTLSALSAAQFELLKKHLSDYSLDKLLELISNDSSLQISHDLLGQLFCNQSIDGELSLTSEQWQGVLGKHLVNRYQTAIKELVIEHISEQLKEYITKQYTAMSPTARLELLSFTESQLFDWLNSPDRTQSIQLALWERIKPAFNKDLFNQLGERGLKQIILSVVGTDYLSDYREFVSPEKAKQLLLDKKSQVIVHYPALFSEEQLSVHGNLMAQLMSEYFSQFYSKLDEQIETLRQHCELLKQIQTQLNCHKNASLKGFLVQAYQTLEIYLNALLSERRAHLDLILNESDRVLQEYYSALTTELITLIDQLRLIIGKHIISQQPGKLAYQAYTLLAALLIPDQFYKALHSKPVEIGVFKDELYRSTSQINLDSAKRLFSFLPAIFRKPKINLYADYQLIKGSPDQLIFATLTKHMVLNCLDYIAEHPQDDSEVYGQLKSCLEDIYNSTEGDLNTEISDFKKLDNLLKLFPKPQEMFPAQKPTSEQTVIIYLLKTSQLYSLWQYPVNLHQPRTNIKKHIAEINQHTNLFTKITLQDFLNYVIPEQPEENGSDNDKATSTYNNSFIDAEQFKLQLRNEKDHLPKDQQCFDPVDALRANQLLKIKSRLSDWKHTKNEIDKNYLNNAGAKSAKAIVEAAKGKITYSVLYELSVFWQKNHHSITTILRPGRWFSPDNKPRVMHEIDLLLQRFECNLASKSFSGDAKKLELKDQKVLQLIAQLYSTRTHINYFKQSCSSEIVNALEGAKSFKKMAHLTESDSFEEESIDELLDCYQFNDQQEKKNYKESALRDLEKNHRFFCAEKVSDTGAAPDRELRRSLGFM